jgi:RNA polymerase sigma factor for flagellar operon FliA
MDSAVEELPLYKGLTLDRVCFVQSAEQADIALPLLLSADVLGFDTESKPTFTKGEVSTGPHLIQLATDDMAFLFPVRGAGDGVLTDLLKTVLESSQILKVGFGLRDDLKRLKEKLGIDTAGVLDLARALRGAEHNDVGAKSAVVRFFSQRLQKSKRISTTNWSLPRLNESQLLYAANDAHVALKMYRAWRAREADEKGAATVTTTATTAT